jgi:hypothetical protein
MLTLALFVPVFVGFLMVFIGGIVLASAESLSSVQPASSVIHEGSVFADASPSMPADDALPLRGQPPPPHSGYFSQVDDPRPGFWETVSTCWAYWWCSSRATASLDPDIEDWQEWRMSLVMRKLTLSTAEAGRFSVC